MINTVGRGIFPVKKKIIELHICLKCHSSKDAFHAFPNASQLTGFYISETLAPNGLKVILPNRNSIQ